MSPQKKIPVPFRVILTRAYLAALALPLLGVWTFLLVYRLIAGGAPGTTGAGFGGLLVFPLSIDIVFAVVNLPVFLLGIRRMFSRPVWYIALYTGPVLMSVVTGLLMSDAPGTAPMVLSLVILAVGYWMCAFRFSRYWKHTTESSCSDNAEHTGDTL